MAAVHGVASLFIAHDLEFPPLEVYLGQVVDQNLAGLLLRGERFARFALFSARDSADETTCIIETDMADAARASIPATAVADELLKLTSKVLAALEQEMAEFEDGQASKQVALQQLVDRDRAAVARATEELNELYRTAREIADNKGRRDVLEGVLRQTVEADTNRTFDQVVSQLQSEMKLARGITGAMRVPDIGALLNQAAVQVDHLEARADALEANLGDGDDTSSSAAQLAFDKASATLRRDLDAFDAELPLPARDWGLPEWSDWQASSEPASLVRFGRFTDDRLGSSGIPALIDLETDAGLLIEPGRERELAVAAAQSLALRLLAAFPAGSARFTFIDPSALGESVVPFQRLVSGEETGLVRVLTDERAIEDALAELTAPTDDSRRREVVVVFDHPTGMSLRGVTLLRTLADSGARRGVTTIVVKDPRPVRQPAEARALPTLRAVRPAKKGFITTTGDGNWRVDLDEMPPSALTNGIVAAVEQGAEHAPEQNPAELVDESTWWLGDAAEHVQIVLGRAGRAEPLGVVLDDSTATVVASGPPGSGLTTMLHGVITDIGMTYAPTEVQLMLVGLGGSRDFEDYGRRRLPHARLVATSADRELAVSALESAVAEITRRLVLFQAADTSRGGYRQYRDETGNALPRLIVIVDGADELFAHHDKLARETRDLLARFALDGGVAGVHLLLTSHDASGEPRVLEELADDTITRVVLSATDPTTASVVAPARSSHSGATSGSLRAVDLAEHSSMLRALRIRADADRFARAPQVVDGREGARIEDAPLDLLRAREPQVGQPALVRMWLGEPAALGSPVEVVLSRRDGANMLVVHDRPDVGQGLLAGAVLTAALANPGQLELYVLDFMPVEDGFGEAVLPLGDLAHTTTVARRRNLPETLERVRNTVVNRLARNHADAPPCLLVVNGLDAAHDLARGEAHGNGASHGGLAHLEQIVSEGPAVGVHTLLWGTSLETLDRQLTRETWRGFALRVVGPLDGATSQAVIDSPAAASLRPHQTLLYDEFEARLVRSRPYAIPDASWLSNLRAAWPVSREAAGVTLR